MNGSTKKCRKSNGINCKLAVENIVLARRAFISIDNNVIKIARRALIN